MNEKKNKKKGHGIFVSDNEIWKRHRNSASRIFTIRSLKDLMCGVFCDTTDRFLIKLNELRQLKDYPKNGIFFFLFLTF